MTAPFDKTSVPGWGVDLDRANRPGVPKERMPARLDGVHWIDPPAQERTVEVLKSTEHVRMPPVFGSSVPPRGVSGWVRRRAFRHSENDVRHWLMLLGADRIDALEGAIADAGRSPRTWTVAGVAAGIMLASVAVKRARGR